MQEHTNEELAALIRQGRTEFMAELWEQVRRLIMKMIFQLLRKRPLPAWADKEDAVQCGFFALIKAVEAYRPEDGFLLTSYLSYCVRNALNSELWGRKKEVAATSYNQPAGGEESETELLELIEDDSAPLAFEEVELTDVQQAVIEAMAALPDDMREMIRLKYYDGLTVVQAAGKMGLKDSQARALEAKAVRELRKDQKLRALAEEFRSHYAEPRSLFYLSPERYAIRDDERFRAADGRPLSYGYRIAALKAAARAYEAEREQYRKERLSEPTEPQRANCGHGTRAEMLHTSSG